MEILYRADFFEGDKAVSIQPRLPQPEFPEHGHEFHELILVDSGSGLHFIDGYPHLVGKGSLFYIPAGQAHYFDHVDDLCLTNVLFTPEQLNTSSLLSLLPDNHDSEILRIGTSTLQECSILLSAISTECVKNDECARPMVESLFAQLVVLLWRDRYVLPCSRQKDDKVHALIRYIDRSFAEDIDFSQLAEQFELPLRTMTRRIEDATGLSPNGYLGRVRLCNAMRMLQRSQASITDIAFSCGFNDSNYFSSRFHHELGLTPKQFRLKNNGQLGRSATNDSNLALNTR
jgi:AraC family L-rhamnose operon regulatory protein RhaS